MARLLKKVRGEVNREKNRQTHERIEKIFEEIHERFTHLNLEGPITTISQSIAALNPQYVNVATVNEELRSLRQEQNAIKANHDAIEKAKTDSDEAYKSDRGAADIECETHLNTAITESSSFNANCTAFSEHVARLTHTIEGLHLEQVHRQEEEARQAELRRQEELRQAELRRQQEEEARQAELRRQEELHQAELRRQQEEEARQAELRLEQARQLAIREKALIDVTSRIEMLKKLIVRVETRIDMLNEWLLSNAKGSTLDTKSVEFFNKRLVELTSIKSVLQTYDLAYEAFTSKLDQFNALAADIQSGLQGQLEHLTIENITAKLSSESSKPPF